MGDGSSTTRIDRLFSVPVEELTNMTDLNKIELDVAVRRGSGSCGARGAALGLGSVA